jgi:hypothetical protein
MAEVVGRHHGHREASPPECLKLIQHRQPHRTEHRSLGPPGVAGRWTLGKTKERRGIVYLDVQPVPLPVLPLVPQDSGKEARAAPPEEDPTNGAELGGGTGAEGE